MKAIQTKNGGYRPVTSNGKTDGPRVPWKMSDLKSHVAGKNTYGHYVVSAENTAKVFCFDIDLEKEIKNDDGTKREPRWDVGLVDGRTIERSGDARKAWHPERLWVNCPTCKKGWYSDFAEARCSDPDHQWTVGEGDNPDTMALTARLQETAWRLAARTATLLEVPVAVSYSGNKGVHVYGLVGEQPARDVRIAAELILDSFDGRYAPSRGRNFFRDNDEAFDCLSIEVFPKQESLDGKDLGNLIRLPLGINRKSGLRGYFLLNTTEYGYLREADAMTAMQEGSL